jgi:hypothetical protein
VLEAGNGPLRQAAERRGLRPYGLTPTCHSGIPLGRETIGWSPGLAGSGTANCDPAGIEPACGEVIDVPDRFTPADLEAAARTGDSVLASTVTDAVAR